MRKQRIENAAHELATQVRTVEDSIEAAIAQVAELQTRMVHIRGIARANMLTSHAAFEQLAATTSSLVAARGGIAHCHVALTQARQSVPGLRTVAIGDDDCPPPPRGLDLRIVASTPG